MNHGELAAQVLRGQVKTEALRRQRAAEVDHHLDALSQTLSTLAWQRPLEESQALAEDWWQLVRAVDSRSISAAASDLGHRLRVEQSLQVMDLLTVAWAPATDPQAAVLRDAAVGLPRLALAWAPGLSGHTPRNSGVEPATGPGRGLRGQTAAQQALLHQARLLGALGASPAARADSGLAAHTLAAQQATHHLLALLQNHAPAGDDTAEPGSPVHLARQATLRAVAATHAAVWQQHLRAVDGRLARHERARNATVGTLAALLLAGAALLHSLRRRVFTAQAAPALPSPAPKPPGPESGPEAGRLLQRLRDADTTASHRRQHHGPDAQPTLPPVD